MGGTALPFSEPFAGTGRGMRLGKTKHVHGHWQLSHVLGLTIVVCQLLHDDLMVHIWIQCAFGHPQKMHRDADIYIYIYVDIHIFV
jgi:hypothetical protein